MSAPTNTRNGYTTICVARARLEVAAASAHPGAPAAADRSCRFLSEQLDSFDAGTHVWQRYWEAANDRVVNTQALVATLFARAAVVLEDEELLARADSAMETTLAHQSPDGSWLYGADGRADFGDIFHTGFLLQSMAEYGFLRSDGKVSVGDSLAREVTSFKAHLITPDGMPRGFANGAETRDGQSVAQTIQTLAVAGDGRADLDLATAIWERARNQRDHLADSGQGYVNLRWSARPWVLATAHLISTETQRRG